MRPKILFSCLVVIAFLAGLLRFGGGAQAAPQLAGQAQTGGVTAYDLILATNTLRTSYGLPALIEDPIVNAVAQATAETMAINEMSWHIGDVRGRLAAAGYGGGATVWATENFAVGSLSIDEIMLIWSDSEHMRPVVNPAYCNVGAGVATSPSGRTYYVLQAAYTSSHACGDYYSPVGPTSEPGESPVTGGVGIIIPVKIATPDADGKLYHIVETGQSFWAIAVAYQITIRDLEFWNNISRAAGLQVGQRLFIPSSSTEGYATPTPVGMVTTSMPDADGKVIHTVQPYQALITIAEAYEVSVETILALNGLQADWPLQIGQKLMISPGTVTPSPTPRPLTPLEKLTPASDGSYYHVVQSGETLSWIAGLYEVNLADLMAWNGLNNESIIRPDQKLILQVTPPAPPTATPGPPTATAPATPTPRPATATPASTATVERAASPTPEDMVSGATSGTRWLAWVIGGGLAIAGLALLGAAQRRKRSSPPEAPGEA